MSVAPSRLASCVPYLGPIAVAVASWVWIVTHLDPAGSYPQMPPGPGLTVDETFNVQQGVILVEAVRTYGVGLLEPAVLRDVFSPPLHLPDHPPLGRVWLGVHHHLWWWLFPPADPEGPFVTACARAGSATAFALTVLLVGCCSARWYGWWSGLMTASGFLLIPRLFGHGHIAALESVTNLTWSASVIAVAMAWDRAHPPKWSTAAWTGAVFGLALLTKIQAVLIPLPIIVWALARWRRQALVPLTIWGATGFVVFFLGWPWLWLDPVGNLSQYLGGAANRATLSVWLWGHQYTDRTVPRYYAFLYWWATVPLKIHVLGFLGWITTPAAKSSDPELKSIQGRWTPGEFLLGVMSLWPLAVFSLPGVPVYDGERLWLPALAVWLVFFGRGCDHIVRKFASWKPQSREVVRSALILMTVVQVVMLNRFSPCYLSFYSGTAGGMAGAHAAGLELDYWGSAVTRPLLERLVEIVPQGGEVAMTPVLHQFQTEELWRQSPVLRRHGVQIVAFDPAQPAPEFVLLFRRLADLPEAWRGAPDGYEPVADVIRDGVQLAALYRRVAPSVLAPGQ